MIVELTVENLAIIEKAQVSLGPGFTVLTGETGAGKSLLVDALELALGERADTELVRTGAFRAGVSVVLDLSSQPALLAQLTYDGVALEDSSLFIQREVFAEGRSQCRIGGKLTPVSILKQIGTLLVDLHGQHAHQSLLDADRHIGYLDAWIGPPTTALQGQIRQAYGVAEEAKRRLSALQASMRDREHRLDLLRFQVKEIETVAPQPGEVEELEAQLVRLRNVERLASVSFGALEALQEKEGCAIDAIGTAVKALDTCTRFDAELEAVLEPLRSALYALEEGTHGLRAYSDALEADPAVLEQVAERIDALKRLRRKYGEDEAQVLEFLERAREELASLEDSEWSEAALAHAVQEAEGRLIELCSNLSLMRRERAGEFAELVERELRDLAMERAIFEVRVATKPPSADGADRVEFFFSANAGEPPRPLGKIASGGEMSRVMLAIKTALAGKAGVPTLIFDEVDAGLGGKAAAVLGKKLEELAQHYQVVAISHLPQIASRAVTHYRIEKGESGGRVTTNVRLLKPDERVEELARMLAGEHVTESARQNARDMLSGAV